MTATQRYRQKRYWPLWLGAILLLAFLVADWYYPLPSPERIRSVIVLAEDRTPLRAFADPEGVWRYPVKVSEVSPLYLQALLTYEDRWFYYHPGINPMALLRAAWQWIRNGRVISGGSTLTMQVARIIDPHERSIPGKVQQMFRALQLEWYYSKEEILSFYLNLAPYGGPIEGVQTASYAYLHKPVNNLSHAEAALMAVLPQLPSELRPDRYPERAQAYRDKVLARMATLRVWDSQTVQSARLEKVYQTDFRQPFMAPLLSQRLKDTTQYQNQAQIHTTINPNLQWIVENILSSRLGQLPERASAAIMVMENATGLVRAYAGSAAFFSVERAGHVDMVQGVRSPGSTLKPFLYGLAIEQGLIHSASLLSDAPLKLAGYAPQNFMQDYRGAVSVAEALQLSLNIPAVDLLQRLTPGAFDARLRHGGIYLTYPQQEQANLSLILGGAGSNLEQLVRGFSALARGGLSIKPRYTHTEPLEERRLLSPGASWIIGKILQDVAPPAGFSARELRLSWKTGTSYGFRDAWSIGFNQRYTVGIWTGRPDGTPLPGSFGARAAGPLLFETFQALPKAKQPLRRPANVTQESICWPLGLAETATEPSHCHRRQQAWVVDKMTPPTLGSLSATSWSAGKLDYWINPATGKRIIASCHSTKREKRTLARWPFETHPWLSASRLAQMQLPEWDTSCPKPVQNEAYDLAIRHFDDSSRLQLPLQNQTMPQVLRVKLQASGGTGDYLWLVNDKPIGWDSNGDGLLYQFEEPGEYELKVLDTLANVDRVNIRIVR